MFNVAICAELNNNIQGGMAHKQHLHHLCCNFTAIGAQESRDRYALVLTVPGRRVSDAAVRTL